MFQSPLADIFNSQWGAAVADPISTAAGAGIASGKLLNVAAAFLGWLVAIGTSDKQMPLRMLAALSLLAALFGYFVPPMAVAAMRQYELPVWLQSEGFVATLIGLSCIYINRALKSIGNRFSKDLVGFVVRRGQDSREESRHDN